jgi:hypothetical protein
VRGKFYFSAPYRGGAQRLLGFQPYGLVSAGIAQIDSHVTVPIAECARDRAGVTAEEQACVDSPSLARERKTIDVYQRSGRAFVAGGIGLRYGASPRWAASLSVQGMLLAPSGGFALSPAIGVSTGF